MRSPSHSQRDRFSTMSVTSSVPSHIVRRPQLTTSGPVRAKNLLVIKQHLMYNTVPVQSHKESIFFRLQESVAHADKKLSKAKENTRMMNVKSDEIVKRSQQKFDFTTALDAKTRRFEQNMKAFEKLSTFINVRDVLQNMNTANQEKPKNGPKLPPLQILKEEESEYVVSPVLPKTAANSARGSEKRVIGFGTPRGLNISSVEDAMSLRRLSKGLSRRAKSTKNSMIQVKDEDMEFERPKRKDSYEVIMEKTMNVIAGFNEADNRAKIFENTGKDMFYMELQENIIHNKFEVKRNNLFSRQQEISEEQYYKGLIEFKEEAEAIDKKYYDNYKAKTEKVLEMLKRASKDIFNRVSTRKKPVKLGKGAAEQQALEEDLRDKWKNKLEKLLESERFKGQYIEEETYHDLEEEFQEMMAKVNNIILIYQANQKRRDDIEEEEEEIVRAKSPPRTERQMVNKLNHEINKYHKDYMRNIIESAENHETILRKTKDGFRKKIVRIEDGYDKDILRIFPRDFESLRSDRTWNSLYMDRPLRRNFSRKALNALNH